MKKSKIIVGNWKMNPQSVTEAETISSAIIKRVSKSKKPLVILCPSYIHLTTVSALVGKSAVKIGAQDFFSETKGSFTGEVSIDMVRSAGATYSIIGHSERRALGETDELINKKIQLALKSGITPIVCIGESTRDEEGKYYAHIKEQIEKAFQGISKTLLPNIIIAYEPIWAIGATEAMDASSVHEMTIFIKKTLVDLYKLKTDPGVPILYGGSVDPINAHSILTSGEADGLLIGRQSLVPESFIEIINLAERL